MGRGRQRIDPLPSRQGSGTVEIKCESKVGALGLQEAPVFYPTEEDFENPLRYIAQIRPLAEVYGICRIVPPNSWNPPFGLDLQSFSFPTKLQAIHQLQERPAACDTDTFKLEYGRYLRKEGEILECWPSLDSEELDLCKLFNAVKRHGGFEKVTLDKKWGEVLRMLKPSYSTASASSSLPATLRELYEKYLYDYELYQTNVGSAKGSRASKKFEFKSRNKGRRAGRRRESGNEVEGGEVVRVGKRRQSLDNDERLDVPLSSVVAESRLQASLSSQSKRRKIEESFLIPDEGTFRTDQICEQCHSGAHEQMMLLCDRCDRGWHLYCLSPPLPSVPPGNWYCLDCIASERDCFGFSQGHEYTADSFRRMADRFKRKWFGTRPSTYSDVEKEFWQVVERATDPVEVLYGSDLDTGIYGSGFPRPSDPVPVWCNTEAWDEFASSPWNLNNFPKLEGSMLQHVHDNIPGVMVPWLYMGMMFSSFCWHYEDHCFYSVNYLHCGEPKSWYSVPGSAADAFEQVMKKAFPDLFDAQPDLLFQLVTMLNPTVLRDNGVPVCTTVQEPHNFVITFPRSYHGGFNHGFNCAEAVNFAPADWLPFGGFGVERYRLFHKAAVLSHDELLCIVAKNDSSVIMTNWLQQELSRVVTKERNQREHLWSIGMVKSSRMTLVACEGQAGNEEDLECVICRYYLHLSAVICSCRPGKAVCLQHARQLCECGASQQTLLYRYTLAELDDLCTEDRPIEDCKVGDLAAASSNNKRRLRRGQYGASSLRNSVMKKVKGRFAKHTELAEAWLTQARAVSRSNSRRTSLADLLSQAEEFLWAGHEMDQVQAMVQELSVAHKWVQDVAACSMAIEKESSSCNAKGTKVSLSAVQKLVEIDPIPWVEFNLPKLKAVVGPACTLQQKIADSLLASPPLEMRALLALQQEASHCPLELPGLQALKDAISSAQDWSDRVKKLLPCAGKTPLNQLHGDLADLGQLQRLQEEGLAIPVMVGEKTLIDTTIQSVQRWQLGVNQFLTSPLKIEEIMGYLNKAEAWLVRTEEAGLLEQRHRKACIWRQHACEALGKVQLQKDYPALIKLIEELLEEEKCLLVQGLEEVHQLQSALVRLKWLEDASKALQEISTVGILNDLIVEGNKLQLGDNEDVMVEIQAVVDAASAWEFRAASLLRVGGSLEDYNALLKSAEKINAKLSNLMLVKNLISDVHLWLDKAQPYLRLISEGSKINGLSRDVSESLQLSPLKTLVTDSQKLVVVLDEAKLLNKLLETTESWVSTATTLKGTVLVNQNVEKPLTIMLDRVSEKQSEADDSFWVLDCLNDGKTVTSQLEEDLSQLHEAVLRGLDIGLCLPDIYELQGLAAATLWRLKAYKIMNSSPNVKDLECLLKEATGLCVELPEYFTLQRVLDAANVWLKRAASILPGFCTSERLTEDQIVELLEGSKSIPAFLASEVEQIETILASHRAWKRQVGLALGGNTSITWSALLHLQELGMASVVESEEYETFMTEMTKVSSWISWCHKEIGLPFSCSTVSCKELLHQMQKSVERAIKQVGTEDVEGLKEFSCVCQETPQVGDSSMLRCDSCLDWYHSSCLGLTHTQTRAQKQYVCPFCSAISTGSLILNEDAWAKIHVTQRPTLTVLQELLSSAEQLKCRLEERDLLESVVILVDAWQQSLNKIIKPAELLLDRKASTSRKTMLSALKAVTSLEVQEGEGSKMKRVLAVNAWRMKTIKLLEGSAKPCLRPLSRALREGLALFVPGDDCILQALKHQEASASRWASQARQVIGDHGRMPLTEVHSLITEGEALPVAFSKELTALKERSILYCVCQKPYDEDRAMIACDRCGEWYHYSCINLPEPESSEEDLDGIQQECGQSGEFVCPKCEDLGNKRDPLKLDTEMSANSEFRNHSSKDSESMDKVVGGPLYGYVRGKRSNRGSRRESGDMRHKWQSPLFAPGKLLWHTQKRRKQREEPETCVSGSGRPCRRTAGRHSGFESFVVLMQSRSRVTI